VEKEKRTPNTIPSSYVKHRYDSIGTINIKTFDLDAKISGLTNRAGTI
jgi:hypothetical protein